VVAGEDHRRGLALRWPGGQQEYAAKYDRGNAEREKTEKDI
jgi:hypothetical protein